MPKQPTAETPEQREGFAIALVEHMFPHDPHNPKLIQFFYDWETEAQHHGGTRLDPLNVRKGNYADPHAALLGSQHALRGKGMQALTRDLEREDTASAREWLAHHRFKIPGNGNPLPSPVDKNTGQLKGSGGNWATALDQSGALAAPKALSSWFSQNKTLALVLIVVIIFAVVKK